MQYLHSEILLQECMQIALKLFSKYVQLLRDKASNISNVWIETIKSNTHRIELLLNSSIEELVDNRRSAASVTV